MKALKAFGAFLMGVVMVSVYFGILLGFFLYLFLAGDVNQWLVAVLAITILLLIAYMGIWLKERKARRHRPWWHVLFEDRDGKTDDSIPKIFYFSIPVVLYLGPLLVMGLLTTYCCPRC